MTEQPSHAPDSNKSDRKTPPAVQTALEALKILADEDLAAAESLSKLRPAFAMKLFKAGEEVTVENLLDHARQGVEHLTASRTVLAEQKPLTYAGVIARLKTDVPAADPKEDKTVQASDKNAPEKSIDDQLIDAAKTGDVQKIKDLLDRGSDIHHQFDAALHQAANYGRLEAARLLIDQGADIHARNGSAIVGAACSGHTEIVRLLLNLGVSVHSGDDNSLYMSAKNGYTETVRLLLERGADANPGGVLWEAAGRGYIEIVRLLLKHGADIHTGGSERPLHEAIIKGDLKLVQFLIDHGADIKSNGGEMLKLALHHDHIELLPLLIEKAGSTKDLHEADLLEYQLFCSTVERWRKTARCAPPEGLWKAGDPSCFRPQAFNAVLSILKEEGYSGKTANQMAFAATALFGTEQRVLQYLEKYGAAGKQPLHDIIYFIKAPQLKGPDIKAWGDAVLKCGPGMAKLFAFTNNHNLVQPEKSSDDKTWSYQNTRRKVAQVAYARATEHAELAALCFENTMEEEDFNYALELVLTQKPVLAHKKDIVKNLPDIIIEGKDFNMEGASFHPLPANDVRGLFLGELTDCCQSIGGQGAACAEHGFMSENGGFYVVEKDNKEIIGQTWAWRGKEGELVFDSLETLGQRVTPQQWKKLTVAFAKALKKNAGNVTALHIGTGGATPESLTKSFNAAAAAQPVDYTGYRDSHKQVVLWERNKWNSKSHKP
jgi:ankyrin repeat protein